MFSADAGLSQIYLSYRKCTRFEAKPIKLLLKLSGFERGFLNSDIHKEGALFFRHVFLKSVNVIIGLAPSSVI